MKRKIYDMPVDEVYLHPEFIGLSSSGRGTVFTLLLHYWLSDCAPLPTAPNELFAVCRPSPRVWATHKHIILKIFNDVSPGMSRNLAYKKMRHEVARDLGERGRGIQRLRTLARKAVAHGAREEAAPVRDSNPVERPARPEERGARARIKPGKSG